MGQDEHLIFIVGPVAQPGAAECQLPDLCMSAYALSTRSTRGPMAQRAYGVRRMFGPTGGGYRRAIPVHLCSRPAPGFPAPASNPSFANSRKELT
jgi:hypothetical protein